MNFEIVKCKGLLRGKAQPTRNATSVTNRLGGNTTRQTNVNKLLTKQLIDALIELPSHAIGKLCPLSEIIVYVHGLKNSM